MTAHAGRTVALPPAGPVPTRRLWDLVRGVLDGIVDQIRRPAAVHRIAELAPGERILSYACDATETSVVATDAALHRLAGDGDTERWSRWGWEQLANARWDADARTLTVFALPSWLPRVTEMRFDDRVPLVDLALERVTWSRQLDTRVRLTRGTVHVTVRRQPRTDRRYWFVHPDGGVDVDTPGTRAELDQVLEELCGDTGL